MGALCWLIQLYLIAIFARIVLSWIPTAPEGTIGTIASFLYRITEPVLGPLRRVLPPVGVGGMAIDLSPLIVVFGIQLLVIPFFC